MKAYSTDLRQKVIDAYKNQEGSQRNLASRFSVSLTFIQKSQILVPSLWPGATVVMDNFSSHKVAGI
jgi:hypothetical protein